jgi:hypothetical protein
MLPFLLSYFLLIHNAYFFEPIIYDCNKETNFLYQKDQCNISQLLHFHTPPFFQVGFSPFNVLRGGFTLH